MILRRGKLSMDPVHKIAEFEDEKNDGFWHFDFNLKRRDSNDIWPQKPIIKNKESRIQLNWNKQTKKSTKMVTKQTTEQLI